MDVIDFIMLKEGTTKHEAILKARSLLGEVPAVPSVPMSTPVTKEAPIAVDTAFLERMFSYFRNGLFNSHPALDYLDSRGLDARSVEAGFNSGQFHHGQRKSDTLNQYAAAIRKFTEFLQTHKQLHHLHPELPYEQVPEETRAIFSQEEIAELMPATHQKIPFNKYPEFHGQRSRAMLTLYYGCGLRRSEGTGLDVSDVQQDRLLVRIRKGKGNRERYVPTTWQTMQTLTEYIHDTRRKQLQLMNTDTQALLINEQGHRCGDLTLSIALRRLIERTGHAELISKKASLHTLRHSISTHLLASGMDIELIQQFLGHKSLDTTQIYTHLAHEG